MSEHRRWRNAGVVLALVVGFAMLTVGCGSGGDDADLAPREVSETEPVELAGLLVAELGSENAAIDAVLLAIDGGYTGPQILEAVALNRLSADGSIADAEPSGQSLQVIESAHGLDNTIESEVQLVQFEGKVPIEKMREGAARAGEIIGENGVVWLIAMLGEGFDPALLIEALILGVDETSRQDNSFDRRCGQPALLVGTEWLCANGRRFATEDLVYEEDEPMEPIDDDEVADSAGTTDGVETDGTAPGVADGSYSGVLVLDQNLMVRLLEQHYDPNATAVINEAALVVGDGQIASFSATLDAVIRYDCQFSYFYTFDGDGTTVVINGEVTVAHGPDCGLLSTTVQSPIEAMLDLQSSADGVDVVVYSDAGRVVASFPGS